MTPTRRCPHLMTLLPHRCPVHTIVLCQIPEKKGLWMEEWHQKLHNNTTPDDVPICEVRVDLRNVRIFKVCGCLMMSLKSHVLILNGG